MRKSILAAEIRHLFLLCAGNLRAGWRLRERHFVIPIRVFLNGVNVGVDVRFQIIHAMDLGPHC